MLRRTTMAICLLVSANAAATDTSAPTPHAALKSAFGGAALDAVGRFDYRLTVTDAHGDVVRDADYALLPDTGRLHVRERLDNAPSAVWSGAEGTWRQRGAQLEFLGPALAQPYRQHVAYHFLPMLRDEATQYQALAPDRIRIAPAGVAPFEALLDAGTGRIRENRFDTGIVGRELDYRRVDGVWWPMAYAVADGGRTVRHGQFSDVSITPAAAMPALELATAVRRLPTPQADVARLAGAGWLSSARNDYNLSTDAEQRLLVFARSAPKFKDSRIWIARRDGDGWSEAAEVPFSDPRYRDSDPWLTPDGRVLYFVSDRPIDGEAPRKDLDIWRVTLEGERFGTPEHLAAAASDGEELGPEVHDGWLYFNSSRQGGPAKLAIYRARVNGRGFDAPRPLGAPFNDGVMQGDFTLSPDRRLAVFWSQRDGSPELDLFAARRTGDRWSAAVRLPSPLNAPGLDFTPAFSADGNELRFASMRKPPWIDDAAHVLNGQANVYVAPVAMVANAVP